MSTSNDHLTLTARPRIYYAAAPFEKAELLASLMPKWTEFTARFMQIGTKERKELETVLSKEDLTTLIALPLLRRVAVSPRHRSADLEEAVRRLIPGLDAEHIDYKRLIHFYAGILNRHIERAFLHVIAKDNQPIVTIRCRDLREACFVWASFGGLEVCPGCHQLFAPNPQKEEQRFCSPNCGQRIYQREFRKRQKKAASKRRR